MNDINMDTKANTGGGKKLNICSLCSEALAATPPLFCAVCVCYIRVCVSYTNTCAHTSL